jgi:hypothetical protein
LFTLGLFDLVYDGGFSRSRVRKLFKNYSCRMLELLLSMLVELISLKDL